MGKEEMACRTDLWHLALLKRAIEEVDERYIRSGDLAHHDKPEDVETEITLAERVFAYELYRQWANLLEPYRTGLVLNGETRKDFIRDFQIKFKSKRNNSNNDSNALLFRVILCVASTFTGLSKGSVLIIYILSSCQLASFHLLP